MTVSSLFLQKFSVHLQEDTVL